MTDEATTEQESIHEYFELSYANYLVLPRVILQSMPKLWQRGFVGLLDKIEERFGTDWEPEGGYRVKALNKDGKQYPDYYASYDRGHKKFKPIEKVENK